MEEGGGRGVKESKRKKNIKQTWQYMIQSEFFKGLHALDQSRKKILNINIACWYLYLIIIIFNI